MIQQYVLPEKLRKIEIKTLHERFIRSVIWVREKAGQIIIKCCRNHLLYDWYSEAMKNIEKLA